MGKLYKACKKMEILQGLGKTLCYYIQADNTNKAAKIILLYNKIVETVRV